MMVQMNRITGQTEKWAYVSECLPRSDVHALVGGNRYGCESRMEGEGLEVAHNGVRGDDVVGVREAR